MRRSRCLHVCAPGLWSPRVLWAVCHPGLPILPASVLRLAPAPAPEPYRLPPCCLPRALQANIDLSDEIFATYEDVKLRHKHKYFIFSLEQTGVEAGKSVWAWKINSKSEPMADDKNAEAFASVVKQLPADEHRFVVFDFTESKADGRQIKKLLLIKWCVREGRDRPEGARQATQGGRASHHPNKRAPSPPCPPQVPRYGPLQDQDRRWRLLPEGQGEAAGPGQGRAGCRHERPRLRRHQGAAGVRLRVKWGLLDKNAAYDFH